MRWFRCAPFTVWLLVLLGGGLVAVGMLTGSDTPLPQPAGRVDATVLDQRLPALLDAASRGQAQQPAELLATDATRVARQHQHAGASGRASAYRSIATFARTVRDDAPVGETRWRAETLAAAVTAAGLGDDTPVPAGATPPTTTARPFVPPASERVQSMAV